VSSDATPNTVDLEALDAVGEFGELCELQPVIMKLIIAAHTVRRVRMFFLIIESPF
jgi:hypothetical protein